MDRDKLARKRFADRKWDGLAAMVESYAAEAVQIARADYRETLDWTPTSLERLERILNKLCPAPETLAMADSEWLTLLWGSYFGELLRKELGGEWEMTIYPGTEFSVPTLEIAGSRMYPMLKVNRRLTLGAGEGIPAFYAMLEGRLRGTPKATE